MTAFPALLYPVLKPPQDVAGRLVSVTRNGAAFESYTYDSNDNRLTKTTTAGTTTYGTDDQDRLLSAVGPDGAQSWLYDANGDLLQRNDSSGQTTLDYDTTGQLLSVTRPNGDMVSYELDAGNKRAVKRVNGVVQRKWLYVGGLLPVAEYDANDNLVAVFNGGYNGYMVKNGATYQLLRDHLGSVRLVVDAGSGTVLQRLSYGPWGEVLEDTNPGFQPFGYAGGLYDPDTGLVRFGVRDYDSTVGRWTCKDPIGLSSGINVYVYSYNDPINVVDPIGLTGEFLPPGVGDYPARDFLNGLRDIFWGKDQSLVPKRPVGTEPFNSARGLSNLRPMGGERLGTMGGTSTGVVGGTVAVVATGTLAYVDTANILCQYAISVFTEKYEESKPLKFRCSQQRQDFNKRMRLTREYENMIKYCNSLGVFRGARDYANSLLNP